MITGVLGIPLCSIIMDCTTAGKVSMTLGALSADNASLHDRRLGRRANIEEAGLKKV